MTIQNATNTLWAFATLRHRPSGAFSDFLQDRIQDTVKAELEASETTTADLDGGLAALLEPPGSADAASGDPGHTFSGMSDRSTDSKLDIAAGAATHVQDKVHPQNIGDALQALAALRIAARPALREACAEWMRRNERALLPAHILAYLNVRSRLADSDRSPPFPLTRCYVGAQKTARQLVQRTICAGHTSAPPRP